MAPTVVVACELLLKYLLKNSGLQLFLGSWNDEYGSTYANRSDNGRFLEKGAAASASNANAMLSSSIEVPCCVTAGGR